MLSFGWSKIASYSIAVDKEDSERDHATLVGEDEREENRREEGRSSCGFKANARWSL